MSAPKCTSWLGHKFEERMSSEPAVSAVPKYKAEGIAAINAQVRLMCKVTYERDICVRYGHVIERGETPPKAATP